MIFVSSASAAPSQVHRRVRGAPREPRTVQRKSAQSGQFRGRRHWRSLCNVARPSKFPLSPVSILGVSLILECQDARLMNDCLHNDVLSIPIGYVSMHDESAHLWSDHTSTVAPAACLLTEIVSITPKAARNHAQSAPKRRGDATFDSPTVFAAPGRS
jgi:hypothetical protein